MSDFEKTITIMVPIITLAPVGFLFGAIFSHPILGTLLGALIGLYTGIGRLE